MTVPRFTYDAKFSNDELRRIDRLRWLESYRKPLAVALGVAVFLAVFFAQVPFDANSPLHAICTYGCVPAGIVVGVGTNYSLDRYIENVFQHKWDPIFLERSGKTEAEVLAEQEVLALTDNMKFVASPIEFQRRAVNSIYRKHGLPEPNKF